MAEALGTVASVAGFVAAVDQAAQKLHWIYQTWLADKNIASVASRARTVCVETQSLLREAEEHGGVSLAPDILDSAGLSAERVTDILNKYKDKPTRFQRLRRLHAARGIAEDLANVERELQSVRVLLGLKLAVQTAGPHHRQVIEEIQCVQQTVQNGMQHVQRTRSARDHGATGDLWKSRHFGVPSVRAFMLGTDELPSIRMLKEKVLKCKGGKVAAVGLRGDGGIGKTTACTIVANDEDVKNHFRDAVLWMQLGDDASGGLVVDQIANIVDATGGHSCAREIRGLGEEKLVKVKNKAREWFEEKSILLIVDNVFMCDNGVVPVGNWISVLQDIPSSESCILFSTRNPTIAALSDESVEFAPLNSLNDQKRMFLRHLGVSSTDPRFDSELCDKVLRICSGVPLALAAAAAYVRRDCFSWSTALRDLGNSLHSESKDTTPVLGGHPGLSSVFGAILARLDGDSAFLEREAGDRLLSDSLCYSWTETYLSLSVLDRSSPRAPVAVLANLWNVETERAECICRCFMNLGLGQLADGDCLGAREFRLHDLQFSYCVQRCEFVPLWHGRLLDRFVTSMRGLELPGIVSETSVLIPAPRVPEVYVEAFCRADEASQEYWVENLVRHICGMSGGVVVARDIVVDYRWVRVVAARRSPSDVARHIDHVVQTCRMELQRPEMMSERDVEDLCEAAYIFRHEIPPMAGWSAKNEFELGECPVHPGEWSAGDSGLAHRIVGRLGFSRGHSGALELGSEGSLRAGGHGVIGSIVDSVMTHARGPWLCPKNRCFVGTACSGFERMIRNDGVVSCVAYSLGKADYVAMGCLDGKVYLHRLDSGNVVNELRDREGAAPVQSMAVSRALSTRGSGGTDPVDARWLAAGHWGGAVLIWDVETARCIARLRAAEGSLEQAPAMYRIDISWDGRRVFAGDPNNGLLHVWDVSMTGEQKLYRRVHSRDKGVGLWVALEFAMAALYAESRPLERCSNQVTCFRQKGIRHARDLSAGNAWLGNMRSCVHPARRDWSVSFESDLIREDGYVVDWACVQGCDSRALVAAVNKYHGAVTVYALTGEKLSESPPFRQDEEGNSLWDVWCVAASQADGRTLVATGHLDGMVRIREAGSGTLIGQWQAPTAVHQVLIDFTARRVVGLVRVEGLLVWSFAGDGSRQNGETGHRRSEGYRHVRPQHSFGWSVVGLSSDGQTAVSCDSTEVAVWNSSTGTSARQLECNQSSVWMPRAVTISNDRIWTLVVSDHVDNYQIAQRTLLDSSGQAHISDVFKYDHQRSESKWSASFTPDGNGCLLIIEDPEKGTEEVHEWAVSDDGVAEQFESVGSPDSLPLACMCKNRTRELLLNGRKSRRLAVCRSVRGEEHCTCTAVAHLDNDINSYCAWSNMSVPGGGSSHIRTTVVVGLYDGTTHFMEFRV